MSSSETPTPPSTKPKTLGELFSDEFIEYRREFMAEVAKKAIEMQLETLRKAKEETHVNTN